MRVERGASDHTLKSYREDLSALADYLAGEDGTCPEPGSISVVELRGFVAALHEAGYAKSSIARRLASVRSFFRFGQREGWLKANPGKALRNPRKSQKLPHWLSTDEVGKLLTAPQGNEPPALRDRAILETLYSAGLRVSELVGLADGDLDFKAGVVRVRGKGKRERLAPIGSHAIRALKAWLDRPQALAARASGREAPVFVNRFGTRLTTRSVARMLEKYLRETGLDQRTSAPHAPPQLRHASVGPRRRHPQRARTLRPQEPRHDANLHARQHVESQSGVREGAPAGGVIPVKGAAQRLRRVCAMSTYVFFRTSRATDGR